MIFVFFFIWSGCINGLEVDTVEGDSLLVWRSLCVACDGSVCGNYRVANTQVIRVRG